jgi:hypothetical protein
MKMPVRHSIIAITSASLAALMILFFLMTALAGIHAAITDRTDIVIFIGSLWFTFGLLYLCTSFFSSCPACHRNIYAQSRPPDQLHRNRSRFGKLVDGWQAIVVDVLLHRTFNCMNCGDFVKLEFKNTSNNSSEPT